MLCYSTFPGSESDEKLERYSWCLEHVAEPGFGRIKLEYTVSRWRKIQHFYSYENEIKLNPQAGSQWDGLRHFGHTETGLYYNNTPHNDFLRTDHIGVDRKSGIATGDLDTNISSETKVRVAASSAKAYF